ncbi:hypothetical protein P171DRAFT_522919 [Karstenula rhodostoma CBS 690.94]|uniref:Uncharacterized protein n=1 Tax=Karstenula rhodostoma CBS 690.94 TaxID=1392251 RepID=A0A9P4U9H9_9PLEO|nr:hypothetical protein P171DRAFT_522919 [Karstenula rhodostoma CBS 690.94]
MATTSAPRINGVDPDQASMNAGSDSLTELQGLWKAMHTLSKEDGFRTFAKLVERVDLQDADLKHRDGKINALENQLAAREASHSASNKELFDKFEERHRQWTERYGELRNEAEALKVASKEKDKSIATIQENQKQARARVSDLEKACESMIKSVKKKETDLLDLEAKLRTALNKASDLEVRLEKAKDNTVALDKALKKEENEKQKLQVEATEAMQKLQLDFTEAKKTIKEYKRFTVKMEQLDLLTVTSQLESLWASVAALVTNKVGCDLPNHVLENDWVKLNDNKVFGMNIPLPQNNTNIAKQMRVAVVLGALARLVIKFLLQPTYVLDERGGLRQLLRHQATIDPNKEIHTRSILLSMEHDNQEELEQEMIEFITDDLKDTVCIDVLFSNEEDLETFFDALEDILSQFQKQWKRIQHGRQKLEPSFEAHPSTTKYPWYIVGLPVAAESQKRTSSPLTTTDAHEDTIIVPQIVRMRTEGSPEPITHGWVLQKAQIHAAEEEILRIRRSMKTTPFVEETSSRPRNRPRRTMSISGNTTPVQKKGSRFLP